MAGLVPAIHVFVAPKQDVDARAKPGHDECLDSDRTLHFRFSLSNAYSRHCEERSDEAIHRAAGGWMDCFAEPVIEPRVRADPLARNDERWHSRGTKCPSDAS